MRWQDVEVSGVVVRAVVTFVVGVLCGAVFGAAVVDGAFHADVAPLGVSVQLDSGCEDEQ